MIDFERKSYNFLLENHKIYHFDIQHKASLDKWPTKSEDDYKVNIYID